MFLDGNKYRCRARKLAVIKELLQWMFTSCAYWVCYIFFWKLPISLRIPHAALAVLNSKFAQKHNSRNTVKSFHKISPSSPQFNPHT